VARLDVGKNFSDYLNKIESSVLKLDGFIRDIMIFHEMRELMLILPIEFESMSMKYLTI